MENRSGYLSGVSRVVMSLDVGDASSTPTGFLCCSRPERVVFFNSSYAAPASWRVGESSDRGFLRRIGELAGLVIAALPTPRRRGSVFDSASSLTFYTALASSVIAALSKPRWRVPVFDSASSLSLYAALASWRALVLRCGSFCAALASWRWRAPRAQLFLRRVGESQYSDLRRVSLSTPCWRVAVGERSDRGCLYAVLASLSNRFCVESQFVRRVGELAFSNSTMRLLLRRVGELALASLVIAALATPRWRVSVFKSASSFSFYAALASRRSRV